ncbi:hypothetical protein AMATHDRAFT_8164 [Amanita thiersii Skay4041]|uniref:Uncharacterized protein n=1 Tax=Amanita thiersii Skay4041 TaxID=703135 RepID=A0A2A9ND13_9AGAR|nr:hypothetical protein AMATHDRAFT_8164 [Amanita thiersii Skay4041]
MGQGNRLPGTLKRTTRSPASSKLESRVSPSGPIVTILSHLLTLVFVPRAWAAAVTLHFNGSRAHKNQLSPIIIGYASELILPKSFLHKVMEGMPSTASHPPPPGLNYIVVIQPSLGILIVALTGSAILVPLLVILFFFSTKCHRRKPIFVMNVISIILGLILGISFTSIMYQGITKPSRLLTRSHFVFPACSLKMIPIFVENILLFRLLIVYPYRDTPLRVFISIFFPLVCIKIARVVDVGIFIYRVISPISKATPNPITVIQAGWTHQIALLKIESFLQVVDNTMTSGLFLYKLDFWKILVRQQVMPSVNSYRSYTSTIQGLFWIAVSNFVFPVLLAIVELVFMFNDPSFLHGMILGFVNAYVSIVGVLLATVWAATARWSERHHRPASGRGNNGLSTLRFTHTDNHNIISMTNAIDSPVGLSPSTEDSYSPATASHFVRDDSVALDMKRNKSKAAGLI